MLKSSSRPLSVLQLNNHQNHQLLIRCHMLKICENATDHTQFPGLNISGVNEPAQVLLDECVFQYEHRLIRHIEPAKCNSREAEVWLVNQTENFEWRQTACQ